MGNFWGDDDDDDDIGGGGFMGGLLRRCWPVALALLLAGVMAGDAYLFRRLGGFSGGVRSLSCSCPLVL